MSKLKPQMPEVGLLKGVDIKTTSLCNITNIIRNDWKNINFAAKPYLFALHQLSDMEAMYFQDSARDIVTRFLCNSASWRGPIARLVKEELKRRLKNDPEQIKKLKIHYGKYKDQPIKKKEGLPPANMYRTYTIPADKKEMPF